jgi:hypothetical protein
MVSILLKDFFIDMWMGFFLGVCYLLQIWGGGNSVYVLCFEAGVSSFFFTTFSVVPQGIRKFSPFFE